MVPSSLVVALLCAQAAPAPPGPAASSVAPSAADAGMPASPLPAVTDDTPRVPHVGEAEGPDSEEPSAELEALRALEEVALDPQAPSAGTFAPCLDRLGFGDPQRQRLRCSEDYLDLRDDTAPIDLPPVTDLLGFDTSLVKDRYDIPIEMQPLVAQYIRFFQGPGRRWFRAWMSRSTRYLPLMQPILEEKGLPRDLVYLAMIESGFSTRAYSWAHAAGPWQFISATGKSYGLRQDFWVDERRDPVKATRAAADFLSVLHEEFGHWYLAWAGYNSGANRVRGMIRLRGTNDFWSLSEGRGFAKETKHYVPKLIACAIVAKHYRSFGFLDEEFDFQQPLDFEEAKLVDPVDLEVVARATDTTVEALRDLNPELKRWSTPPGTAERPYLLRLPRGKAAPLTEYLAKLGPRERLNYRVHRVQRGDTLSGIAATYHSAPEAIMRMNGLASARQLRLGTELVVPIPSAGALKAGRADAALERQVAHARRSGLRAARPDEEIPAGTPPKGKGGSGLVATEVVGGKTRLTYGIQQGDSLWTIARQFNCTVAQLKAWNEEATRPRKLKIGTLLHIWQDAAKATAAGGR